MKAKIAVATVSGKAYYILVDELKAKNLPFLSLKPWDHIPLDVKVVITTEKESASIAHPNVLIFKNGEDSIKVIDEAIRIVQGKQSYEKVIIGIDPGETFGVAILGDGTVLATINCSSLKETVNAVLKTVREDPAMSFVVKVGDGVPIYTEELLHSLDEFLPEGVILETVSEAGTSHFVKKLAHLRGLKDAMSAIKIARRNGKALQRGNTT